MNKLEQHMLLESNRLEKSIVLKESQIASYPQGILKSYYDNNRYRRYIVYPHGLGKKKNDDDITNNNTGGLPGNALTDSPCNAGNSNGSWKKGRSRSYLSRSDHKLAEQLAIKSLLELEIADERKELNAIQMYLRHCSTMQSAKNYIESNSDIFNLVSGYIDKRRNDESKAVKDWLQNRHQGNPPFPEGLKVKTHAGFLVRSKSERDIVHALMKHHIPFKYEECLQSDIGPLYPDFTILNPLNNQEVIWEHNGSMDDTAYANRVFDRTKAYYRLGFHPGKNFIMTYEENNEGLDSDWIEAIINQYFTDPYQS